MSYEKYSKEGPKGQEQILTEKSTNEYTGRTEQLQRYGTIENTKGNFKEKENQKIKTSNSLQTNTTPTILNPKLSFKGSERKSGSSIFWVRNTEKIFKANKIINQKENLG
jgi:hypothetical protein